MHSILLISPPSVVFRNTGAEATMYINPPLGLGYLATALRNNKFKVKLFDMGAQDISLEDTLLEIEKSNISVVGISSVVANHKNGMLIAKGIKKKYPEVKIIMGGPHASFIPEEILAEGSIDVVCMFEGENTIVELVESLVSNTSLDSILGIAFKKDNRIIINPRRPLIKELDIIDFPAWDLYDLNCYPEPGIILTGRGCPYECIFCSGSKGTGTKYRKRSFMNVVDEIELVNKEYGINKFFFADYTFIADEKHCIEICREIRKRGLKISWEAEARANITNDLIATEMVKSGCIQVQIGVESGDDNILESIRKNITLTQVEDAVKIYLKHGISVMCSFILGHPEDTTDSINKTIEFACKIKCLSKEYVHCMFSLLTPLPGTPIYEDKEKYGIKLLTNNWDKYTFFDPVIETKNLSSSQLQNLFFKAWMKTMTV